MMLKLAAPLPSPSLHLRRSAANLPRHPPTLSSSLLPHRKTITTVICHGKLDGLYGENPDPVEKGTEAFFEAIMGGGIDDDDDGFDDYDGDEEEETESSIDLFIRFLQSSLKKVSRRAKRASRSVLPSVISPQLISFAVDGVLILTVLFIFKSLLQVFCTLGSTVFATILLVRVVWAVLSYFQSNGNDGRRSSSGTRQAVI